MHLFARLGLVCPFVTADSCFQNVRLFVFWLAEKRFLEVSDVVVPNETELAIMCQATDVDPERDESVCAGARELIERGVGCGAPLDTGMHDSTRIASPSKKAGVNVRTRVWWVIVFISLVKGRSH